MLRYRDRGGQSNAEIDAQVRIGEHFLLECVHQALATALKAGGSSCYSGVMNAKQIWQAALADLEQQVTRPNYQTWLRHSWAVADEGQTFVIGAPNSFTAGWL